MDSETALALAQQISYKPGWRIHFSTNGPDLLRIEVFYRAPNSDSENAPYYPKMTNVSGAHLLELFDIHTREQLWRLILDNFIGMEIHEAREFFAVNHEAYDKPFHPHTLEGTDLYDATSRVSRVPVV